MDYGLYQYDEPYARPVRRRINYFAWTVAILLLTGFAFAAWLGRFFISSATRTAGQLSHSAKTA